MIVKLFALDGAIHIIENLTNVRIHDGYFIISEPREWYKETWGPNGHVKPINNIHPDFEWLPKGYAVRLIDANCGDSNVRMYASQWAYVCTDDGKTIEKVKCEYIQPDSNINVYGDPVLERFPS